MNRRKPKIAIVGAGPSGAALATLLKQRGAQVVLFSEPRRPSLIVGESLIPSVMPSLAALGVLEELATLGVRKEGAVLYLDDHIEWSVAFTSTQREEYSYTYNVPRDAFDSLLLRQAEKAGVPIELLRVQCQRQEGDRVQMLGEAEQVCRHHLGGPPDLVVDATGRSRLLGNLFSIPVEKAGRNDVVLFTHVDEAVCPMGGYIHLDVLKYGWCWRIPLGDRVSVGAVMPQEYWAQYGTTKRAQLQGLLRASPLNRYLPKDVEVRTMAAYTNYQAVSHRFAGSNWVTIGDAAGFLDPVFSSGVSLALGSAFSLLEALTTAEWDLERALACYSVALDEEFRWWSEVVGSFYNGQFLSMIRAGAQVRGGAGGMKGAEHIEGVIARVLAGCASKEDRSLYKMICKWSTGLVPAEPLLQGKDFPGCDLAVRNEAVPDSGVCDSAGQCLSKMEHSL